MSTPTRSPARKRLTRAESRQQTRIRLLDAAETVFARHGFAGTSLEEVAEEAGYSKGAIYSNFASKEELFLALFDRRTHAYGEDWVRVFAPGSATETRVADTEQLLARETGTHAEWTVLELEFMLYALRYPAVRHMLAERYQGIRNAIAATLRRHVEETHQALPLAPDTLAWLFPALALGLDLHSQIAGSMPDDLWKAAVTQLLDGAGTSQG